MNLILLQTAIPSSGTDLILDKGEKLGVVALLGILVWVLHRQNEKREEQVRLLYESRISELKTSVDQLRKELDEIKP